MDGWETCGLEWKPKLGKVIEGALRPDGVNAISWGPSNMAHMGEGIHMSSCKRLMMIFKAAFEKNEDIIQLQIINLSYISTILNHQLLTTRRKFRSNKMNKSNGRSPCLGTSSLLNWSFTTVDEKWSCNKRWLFWLWTRNIRKIIREAQKIKVDQMSRTLLFYLNEV